MPLCRPKLVSNHLLAQSPLRSLSLLTKKYLASPKAQVAMKNVRETYNNQQSTAWQFSTSSSKSSSKLKCLVWVIFRLWSWTRFSSSTSSPCLPSTPSVSSGSSSTGWWEHQRPGSTTLTSQTRGVNGWAARYYRPLNITLQESIKTLISWCSKVTD